MDYIFSFKMVAASLDSVKQFHNIQITLSDAE